MIVKYFVNRARGISTVVLPVAILVPIMVELVNFSSPNGRVSGLMIVKRWDIFNVYRLIMICALCVAFGYE